jgi:quercetin dioxygenase-like cupin family protein
MKYDHYESGQLYGIRYQFAKGERLNVHVHTGETADQAHNVVILRGSVWLTLGEDMAYPLTAGDVFDFDGTVPHGIEALEDNTATLHLMLHGKPASFADYTPEQKHGEG